MTDIFDRAVEHAVDAYARVGARARDELGLAQFAQDLGQATADLPEDAPPMPVHIRLGVGEHPLCAVATAYVAGPGSAAATVADTLRALADQIHPPTDEADEPDILPGWMTVTDTGWHCQRCDMTRTTAPEPSRQYAVGHVLAIHTPGRRR